jgi:hypothetical protein
MPTQSSVPSILLSLIAAPYAARSVAAACPSCPTKVELISLFCIELGYGRR